MFAQDCRSSDLFLIAQGLVKLAHAKDGENVIFELREPGRLIVQHCLDQLTGKAYTDGTPAVSLSYTADWLNTATAAGVSVTQYMYDPLGRVSASSQTPNGGAAYVLQYQYDLADDLASVTMPSGRVVTTTYNGYGQPTAVTGTLGTVVNKPYLSSVTYAPQGAMLQGSWGMICGCRRASIASCRRLR